MVKSPTLNRFRIGNSRNNTTQPKLASGIAPARDFNRILGYVLDPTQSEVNESPTEFHGHRFDSALLRVNSGVHKVTRS
jgi:hypothetical protein